MEEYLPVPVKAVGLLFVMAYMAKVWKTRPVVAFSLLFLCLLFFAYTALHFFIDGKTVFD